MTPNDFSMMSENLHKSQSMQQSELNTNHLSDDEAIKFLQKKLIELKNNGLDGQARPY